MEIVEIKAAGEHTSDEFKEALRSQFWRFDDDLVVRFNLTGGDKIKDYPNLDFQQLRAEMPPILECQFAIKAGPKWVMR
jgi:hypothetical protein